MKKILVVEDSVTIATSLKNILMEKGYEVVIALDAMQATMSAQRNNPDLILLDIMMPGGGGFSVYKRLKNSVNTCSIPIIFLSGADRESLKEEMTPEMQDVPFFTKPLSIDIFLEKINEIIG